MIIINEKLKMKKGTFKNVAYSFVCLFFYSFLGFSQEAPKVAAAIDTTAIRIGEQIKYKILVEVDSTSHVIFPEEQTFSPLEMVEALKVDTSKYQNRINLQRTYALTQFDSGAYTIPPQRLDIDGKAFFTDSIQVSVGTVKVDTIAQKMYDIKPLIAVDKSNANLWKTLLLIFLIVAVVGALLYWFVFRKKPLTEEEKEALLPPYDRALLELKKLENSKYIIQDEYKKYYSELTTIVRSYLEEDVHVSALESTTDQLIDKLEMLKDAGELQLDKDTITQFKNILQTADLVKFAKSKPEVSVAEQDRKAIKQIVEKTHDALPEPTEEELLQNEEYLEELARKKQKKKWLIAGISAVALLLLTTAISVGYYGFKTVKDTVVGHPTKELLDGEWVASTYGFPPISIETPKVLLRKELELPPEAKEKLKEIQVFEYQSLKGMFTSSVSATTFADPESDADFQQSTNQMLKEFEAKGAKNIITKQEEFPTVSGTMGQKTYGSGKFPVPNSDELVRKKYAILSFGGKGFMQQIMLTWLEDDTYADEIVERIFNSVEVKTEE